MRPTDCMARNAPVQIHIEGAVPVPFIHIQQGSVRFDRGMVDEHVNAAKVIFHLVDQRLHGHFFGNVIHIDFGIVAALAKFDGQGFHVLRRYIVDG